MKFVDLFAGLGGFHLALRNLGHTCVFACDIDEQLIQLYERNFGIKPEGDIRKVDINSIPQHDILCAGFPCQPFSKAGNQQGFNCPKYGDLFDYVLKIIKYHNPNYLMLENVANLQKHDKGNTWRLIKNDLEKAGYEIDAKLLSPHRFGIPQIRERFFIVGSKKGLSHFSWPNGISNDKLSIKSILSHRYNNIQPLSERVIRCLDAWQNFIKHVPENENVPSPVWSMEYGATYPYEESTPYSIGLKQIRKYRGSYGCKLDKLTNNAIFNAIPSYARIKQRVFPRWKIIYIKQNREFYKRHKKWIDKWIPEILPFTSSMQKLEWNCKGEKRDIWKYLIQFRASGVRVKRTTTSPTLISMTSTQIPIIAWEKRYITPQECSRLQSMNDLKYLPDNLDKAFEALGNAVNVKIVESITNNLINKKTIFEGINLNYNNL